MKTKINNSNAQGYAKRNFVQVVFPEGHRFNNVIFYDAVEGKYYNRTTDLFLQDCELAKFGLA